MGSQEERDSTMALRAGLTTLKRRGSNLLVVGAVAADIHQRACHRFLGDETFAPRQRIAVLTGTHHTGIEQYLTGPHSPAASTRIINYAPDARATSAEASLNEESTVATEAEPENLPELKTTVAESIADIQDHNKNLSPAELRVCVDSLLPLIDGNGREAVVRLVYPLAQRIRAAQGMGHFHLPIDPELAVVEEFEPMFEAMIELRMDQGVPEQRWHLRDADVMSEWLPLK